jgi:deoxyribodipyrimidine photolyase
MMMGVRLCQRGIDVNLFHKFKIRKSQENNFQRFEEFQKHLNLKKNDKMKLKIPSLLATLKTPPSYTPQSSSRHFRSRWCCNATKKGDTEAETQVGGAAATCVTNGTESKRN